MISRRKFLFYSGVTAASTAVVGFSTAIAGECTENLEVVETNIPLENLPNEFESFRIGFISDLHLGLAVRTNLVREAAELLNKAKVDLLIMGGDYLWVPESAVSIMLQIERNNDFKKPWLL